MATISDNADLMLKLTRGGGIDESTFITAVKAWCDANAVRFKDPQTGLYPRNIVRQGATAVRKV